MSDGEIRASDSDRENVVAMLREAHAEGRLTLDEFEERMNTAYSARTWASLRELTCDLPVDPVLGTHFGLPAPRTYQVGSGQPPFRRPHFGPVLPLAVIWVALAGGGQPATVAAIAGVLFFIMWLRLAARHHHGRGHGPGAGGSGLSH